MSILIFLILGILILIAFNIIRNHYICSNSPEKYLMHRLKKFGKIVQIDYEMIDTQKFVIYTNNSVFFLDCFLTVKLYWIRKYSKGDELKLLESDLEYQSTWLPKKRMLDDCIKIMNTHPNLK